MKNFLDKLAPLGVVGAAASCSACFPALAGIGSVLGLGVLASYEREALMVMQIFIGLSMLFAYLSFRRTGYKPSFIISLLSGGMMFFSWYVLYHPAIFYLGMLGLVGAAFWNLWIEKKHPHCAIKK
jgi:mercuric ion transport protein